MMNEDEVLIRKAVRNILEEIIEEENEYQQHFENTVNRLGIDGINDLTDSGKSKLFNFVGGHWDNEGDEKAEYSTAELVAKFDDEDFKDSVTEQVLMSEAANRLSDEIAQAMRIS